MPSNDLDEVHPLCGQLLFFFFVVILKPAYSDFSSPLGVVRLSILLSLCLYPSIRTHVLHSTIMDPFFGWTAAALTAYLAGCDSLASQGVPVSCLTPLTADLAANRAPPGVWIRRLPIFNPRSAFRAEHPVGSRFPTFTWKIPRYITIFLPHHSGANPIRRQSLLVHPSSEEQDTSVVRPTLTSTLSSNYSGISF